MNKTLKAIATLSILFFLGSCTENNYDFKEGRYLHEVKIDMDNNQSRDGWSTTLIVDEPGFMDGYLIGDTLFLEEEILIDERLKSCMPDTDSYKLQTYKVPLSKSSDSAVIRIKEIWCTQGKRQEYEEQFVLYYRVFDEYFEIIFCETIELPCETEQHIDRFYFPEYVKQKMQETLEKSILKSNQWNNY